MLRIRLVLSVLTLASFVSLPSFAAQAPHPSRSSLQPCKVDGWEASFKGKKELDALCGTYQVWENREAKAGRKLTLNIVLLPALSPSPAPDPVFYLSGGPGAAATRAVYNDPLRQERDIVFIDQRGTGEPDRLSCALAGGDDDLQSSLGEQFPLDAVRRCRDELGKKYDLTRYTVAAAVDDFDEIRAWLGYGKVNLIGGSYGTRTAQIYLRRHPQSVRTATLWGVVPNDEPVAYSHAAGAQRALDLTLRGCEEDAACHAKLPDVRKDFQAVMDRLAQGPVEVEVPHPKTGKATPVRLSRQAVAEGIRCVLYSAEASAALPVLFHQAAAGDWKPLGATVVAAQAGLEDIITRGLFFSVTCAEDIPFIDPAQVAAHTAGSFLGDDRIRRQTAACALWPKARIDPAQREPLHSDVPVLLINGDLDPVTPPDFGRLASQFLTQSLHIVEPFAGHEESPPCVEGLADEFVRRGTVQGLDTSCLRQMKRTPFLLEVPKEAVKPFGSPSKLAPCQIPGKDKQPVDALCGTYDVWENRDAKAGRKIRLKIVVLPALSANPLPDATFDFTGGPGEADTTYAGYMAGYPRRERDLVFIDQRGTGEPDRLGCDHGRKDDLQSLLGEQFPLDAVRRCRDELGKKYDLTRYTVAAAVDDFDEIRAWLGYAKINLYGSSYGTRTAQIYLQRHPESVRTVTIEGVIPMDEPVALSHAANGQRSLDLMLSGCEEDAACHAKFPNVRQDFQAVMDRLSKSPVDVQIAHPETGKPARVRLSRQAVADGIRMVLYSAKASAALPILLHQAAAGDWKPLGQTVAAAKVEIDRMLTRGLFFSVTCAEDFPFIDPAEVAARTAGSFLGDDRVRRQAAACALWPRGRVDPAQRQAIHSDVPVLLINGELDPVTPPDFGRRAAQFLTQSLHLVMPYASHEDGSPCIAGLADEFLRRGTAKGLDASCLSQLKRKPFLLELPKEAIKPFG